MDDARFDFLKKSFFTVYRILGKYERQNSQAYGSTPSHILISAARFLHLPNMLEKLLKMVTQTKIFVVLTNLYYLVLYV